jgi:hypothetical protein
MICSCASLAPQPDLAVIGYIFGTIVTAGNYPASVHCRSMLVQAQLPAITGKTKNMTCGNEPTSIGHIWTKHVDGNERHAKLFFFFSFLFLSRLPGWIDLATTTRKAQLTRPYLSILYLGR